MLTPTEAACLLDHLREAYRLATASGDGDLQAEVCIAGNHAQQLYKLACAERDRLSAVLDHEGPDGEEAP